MATTCCDGKVKTFVGEHLFDPSPVDLEDPVVLRNLSESAVAKALFDAFKTAINALTVRESGETRVEDWIRLRDTRPFRTERREYQYPIKSVFTLTVCEPRAGGFEMAFAAFLDRADDVQSFTKNYLAVGFNMEYVRTDGELSTYVPDFIVRDTSGGVWIIERKGREELDLPRKMARLRQWCLDATAAAGREGGPRYGFVYVDQAGFEKYRPERVADLVQGFREYQG